MWSCYECFELGKIELENPRYTNLTKEDNRGHGAMSRYSRCQIGARLSFGVTRIDVCVWRSCDHVLHVLDLAKQRSESQVA